VACGIATLICSRVSDVRMVIRPFRLNLSSEKRKLHLRILVLLLLATAAYAFSWMQGHGVIAVPAPVVRVTDFFVFVFFTILAITVLLRFTLARLEGFLQTQLPIEQKILLSKFYELLLYTLGVAVILWRLGVGFSNLTLFVGLITTGIAFAIRDVIMGFFAWLLILTKKPLQIGDGVRIGDDEGEVISIGTFFFTLRTSTGSRAYVKIPNTFILSKSLLNSGKGKLLRTIRMPLKRLPKDIQARIKRLDQAIGKLVGSDKDVLVRLDLDNGWFLKVTYPIPISDEDLRNAVLLTVNREMGALMK